MGERYTLRTETLQDLVSVPKERRGACLLELETLLQQIEVAIAIGEMAKAAAGADGVNFVWPDTVEWADDEQGEVVTNVVMEPGGVPIVRFKSDVLEPPPTRSGEE